MPHELSPSRPRARLRKRGVCRCGGRGACGFGCHFVRTMPLAKKYPGQFRICPVRRPQNFPVETLGRLIHEAYCRERGAAGETSAKNSSLRAWEDLPEDLRASNREQAADIPAKLRIVGYELVSAPGRQ